jgi:hypothetical protein
MPIGARRDGTGFGMLEHQGDGSALPMLVQSGNLRPKSGHGSKSGRGVDVGSGLSANSPDRCCDGRNLQGDPMAALDTVLAKIDANLDLALARRRPRVGRRPMPCG